MSNRAGTRKPPGSASSGSAWAFIAFPLLIVFLFTALPTVVGAGLSLFEWTGSGLPRFIGLQNYAAAFGEAAFWQALRNTLIFAILTVPLTVVLAFLIAVALEAPWVRGRTLLRTIFFLPTIVSIVAIGFIWRWVLDPTPAGLLNHVLIAVGIPHATLPDWLGNTPWGLATIVFVSIWRGVGFSIVLYLAALTNVPRSLYDAAAVDGAGAFQTMWHVTRPGVQPMSFFLLITGMIGALQVFDLVLVMIGTNQQAWTDVLNLYLYREFAANRLGYAAALGVVVLLLTIAVTALQFVLHRDPTSMAATTRAGGRNRPIAATASRGAGAGTS